MPRSLRPDGHVKGSDPLSGREKPCSEPGRGQIRLGCPGMARSDPCHGPERRRSKAELNVREVPERRRRPERREHRRHRPAHHRQHPARVRPVVDEEHLHGEHAVDERPEDAMRETRGLVVWKPRMKMQWNATGSVQRTRVVPTSGARGSPCGRGIGTSRSSFPKMRAPVSTCTTASTTAAVANHALPAIGAEKTDVTMSVYAEVTLAEHRRRREPTGYDRPRVHTGHGLAAAAHRRAAARALRGRLGGRVHAREAASREARRRVGAGDARRRAQRQESSSRRRARRCHGMQARGRRRPAPRRREHHARGGRRRRSTTAAGSCRRASSPAAARTTCSPT